jgi:hypothetical protein
MAALLALVWMVQFKHRGAAAAIAGHRHKIALAHGVTGVVAAWHARRLQHTRYCRQQQMAVLCALLLMVL